MNSWSWFILILIIGGAYIYLNVEKGAVRVIVTDEEYCAKYFERMDNELYLSNYNERVEAVAHGCID